MAYIIVISLLLTIITAANIGEFHGITVTLFSQPADQWENMDIILTCAYNGLYSGLFEWTLIHDLLGEQSAYVDTNCKALSPWLANSTIYAYSCVNDTVHYITIKSITRQNHGERWRCGFDAGLYLFISNTVKIFVKVPVKSATINPDFDIFTTSENSTFFCQCKSSACRPKPKFLWYIQSTTEHDGDTTIISETDPDNISAEIIQSYSNVYSIRLNRTWNGCYLFCGAGNRNESIILSRTILLNVTYPPHESPKIGKYELGSEIKVIEDHVVNLECSISGGNPLPRLEWNLNNTMPQTVSGITVTRSISWHATNIDKLELKCHSIQHHKNDTTYVTINVLYPPKHVIVKLKNKSGEFVNITNTVSVIEGRQLVLNCSAHSNPPVYAFGWHGSVSSDSSYLNIMSIKRKQSGILTCNVSNTMTPSEPHGSVTGNNSSSLRVNVLYPPRPKPLRDKTISEGEDLVYACDFATGNPNTTEFKWMQGDKTWNGQQLVLKNVSRNQSGRYACNVRNTMISSDGDVANGTGSTQFNLIVQSLPISKCIDNPQSRTNTAASPSQLCKRPTQFIPSVSPPKDKAKVTRFMLEEYGLDDNVIVTESEEVTFICEIEGHPLATGEIYFQEADNFQRKQRVLKLPTTSTHFSEIVEMKTVFKALCTDAGILTCTGRNTLYTGIESVTNATMSFYVNCKPRKSPFHHFPSSDTVYSQDSVPVVLNFTALAYPIPPASGFVWSRNTDSTMQIWTTINSNDISMVITTSGLQSNLTIKNVSRADFGLYRIIVENEIGQFNYTFTLAAVAELNQSAKDSQVGAAVGGAVAGAAILIAFITVFILYRKRKQRKEQPSPRKSSVLNKDRNISKDGDGSSSADVNNSNFYEGLQNKGVDQQYDNLSSLGSQVEHGEQKLYANLQLTHNTKELTEERSVEKEIPDSEQIQTQSSL